MPRQLLLEGPAIEPLLQRVRGEHGSTARIIKAERVRVGGVGGFFAKERFEVTVEVDDQTEPPTGAEPDTGTESLAGVDVAALVASTGAPPTRTGLQALLAAAELAELSARVDRAEVGPVAVASPAEGSVPAGAETEERIPLPLPLPAASAARAGFEDVLESLRRGLQPAVPEAAEVPSAPALPPGTAAAADQPAPLPPVAVQAAPPPPGPLAPAVPVEEQPVPVQEQPVPGPVSESQPTSATGPAPEPAAESQPQPALPSSPGAAPPPAVADTPRPEPDSPVLVDVDTQPLPVVPAPLAAPAAAAHPAADPAPQPVLVSVTLADIVAELQAAADAAAASAPGVGAPPAAVAAPLPSRRSLRRPAQPEAAAVQPGEVGERLEHLGVHRRWREGLPGDQVLALRELASRVAELPCTPRRTPDPASHHVVVVLAESRAGLPTAHTLATGLGVRPDEVLVLTGGAPSTPVGAAPPDRASVARVADLARHRDRPVVVLVTVPLGPDAAARAAVRGTLDALRPDQVWAVVDATRRTADAAAWLRQVGPADGVDAVALTGLDATAAPAEALDLAAPVALLDGRPASAVAWVSMLAARLTQEDLEQHLGAR